MDKAPKRARSVNDEMKHESPSWIGARERQRKGTQGTTSGEWADTSTTFDETEGHCIQTLSVNSNQV